MANRKFIKGQYKLNLKNNEENLKELKTCTDKFDKDYFIASYTIGSPDDEDELYMNFKIEAPTFRDCQASRDLMRQALKKVCNFEILMEMKGNCIL
jgi:hypothetical protein